MSWYKIRFYGIAVYLVYLLYIGQSTAYADEYDTCIAVPSITKTSEDRDYLQNETIFGKVKQLVQIGDSGTFNIRCSDKSLWLRFELRGYDSNGNLLREEYSVGTNYHIDVPKKFLLGHVNADNNIGTVTEATPQQLPRIQLSAKRFGRNKLCLVMPTVYGQTPLACKTVTPLSEAEGGSLIGDDDAEPECTFYAQSCMEDRFNSQTLLNFSGRAVQCLRDTLDTVFFTTTYCPSTSKVRQTPISPFPEFQKTMQQIVIALITIYVVFFGIVMALEPWRFSAPQAFLATVKVIVVLYFSVGLGGTTYKQGKEYVANGVIEWGLPIFTQATSDFASFIFSSVNGNGLCSFATKDYPPGKKYYALWDSLDCRVGTYFGILPNYNIGKSLDGVSGFSSRTDPERPVRELAVVQEGYMPSDAFRNRTLEDKTDSVGMIGLESDFSLRFFTALWGYLMVGSILVVFACLSFIIVFLTLIFKLLTTFLLSLVTLHVLAYFSPVFVPMALFERTKGYFQGWLKLCLSCAVRPAVIAGFISLLLVVYDGIFFRDCQFVKYTYSDGTNKFNTYNLAFLQDPGDPANACENSMGYRLFKKYLGHDWDFISLLIIKIYYVTDGWVALESVAYLLLWTMVFFFFAQTMEGLASDISGGPSMESLTGGVYTLLKALRQALSTAGSVASAAGSVAKGAGSVAKGAAKLGGAGAMTAGRIAGSTSAGRAVRSAASATSNAASSAAHKVADSKAGKAVSSTYSGTKRKLGSVKKAVSSTYSGTKRKLGSVKKAVVDSKAGRAARATGRGIGAANRQLSKMADATDRIINTVERGLGSKKAKIKTKKTTRKNLPKNDRPKKK